MRIRAARIAFAAALVWLIAGCSSTSTVQSHPVTDAGGADARRRAEVHTALAGEYYARGNYSVALAETRLAVKEDPSYPYAYNMQGLVYMELRDDVPAREAFDRALALQPNNAEVLNNFGWFLCSRNEGDRGLRLLQQAAADSLYPTPEKAYLSMGLCLRRMHRDDQAEQALRRAVAIRPELIGALYNLALLTYERGAYQDSEKYLDRFMRLANPSLDALVLGVKVARANKDNAGEQSYLQQLRRRYPDAPQARELLDKH